MLAMVARIIGVGLLAFVLVLVLVQALVVVVELVRV